MEDRILSYNAAVQYIPKDGNDEGIVVADYYTVTQRDIDATSQNYELIQPLSPEAALIGTSGAGPDTSGSFIVITENLTDVTLNENTSSTLTIAAELVNGEGQLEYQWEKRESGTEVWTTISGATTTSYTVGPVVFSAFNLDAYRCIVTFADAINSPLISEISVIAVKRVISITQQPVIPAQGFINGLTATFNIAAAITSGTISYQWQKKEFSGINFFNISGATGTTLTTPTLDTIADNGDEYRCVLTNSNADTVISNAVRLLVSGADFEVTPAVSGVTFWRLAVDGALILDPSNSTQYTIKCLDINRRKMFTKMWGQGSCKSKGGYTEGIIPIQQNDVYTIRLNSGRGSGGDMGGGYAGIFNGTTVSQANALLIAGGAGGGSASSSGSCVYSGGTGGGSTGGDGVDASVNATGGDGGTQSTGGAGGTTGSSGSALQGGAGGGSFTYNGGGGGGGYFGGGGGAGNNASSGSGAGGGGSGFIAPTVISGFTSSFANESDLYRGTAGDINTNSRFVISPVNIVISQQPSSLIVVEGNSVTFNIVAQIQGIIGQQINYQWEKKEYLTTSWVTISGATSSSYTINNVSNSDTSDFYRCILTNEFCPTVVSNEADITVITQTTNIIYRTAGNANFTIPQGVDKVKFYMWGAGGDGTGEACGGPYSGGSGGYLSGTIDTTGGEVFLARVGSYNNGSQTGLEGYGAGKGGGWTGLFKEVSGTPTLFAMVGGGGGAGQAGNGGGGGAPGNNGGNGTGPNYGSGATGTAAGSGGSFYTSTVNFNNGGPSGGSGINQGNRGGGGGGGYYGGGGGSGNDSGNCSGGGGGGGSGFIDTNYLDPNNNSYTSSAGNTGSSSGADPSVKGTLWQDFVNSTGGYQAGRSGNNGLIIFELTYLYDFQISPAVANKQYWSLLLDGPLVLDAGNSTSYTITPLRNLSRNIKMWGQGSTSGSASGGYSQGSVLFDTTKTYQVRLNAGAGDRGAGGYSGIFMTSVSQSNAIMIAGGAGGKGNNGTGIGGGSGGLAGGGGGSSGSNGTGGDNGISQQGFGGSQISGGSGGAAPSGNLGTRPYGGTGAALQGGNGGAPSNSYQDAFPFGSGQWYYYGNVWGGGGGGGYFGGGGGGGGGGATYGGPETEQYSSSGGGGGSGYINTTYVVNGSTGIFSNSTDPNRGNAGTAGYNSRIVITS